MTSSGDGVFDLSIAALQQLNALRLRPARFACAEPGSGNPWRPLSPDQQALQADYKRELAHFGIVFNELLR
jgi:hypothetical protein